MWAGVRLYLCACRGHHGACKHSEGNEEHHCAGERHSSNQCIDFCKGMGLLAKAYACSWVGSYSSYGEATSQLRHASDRYHVNCMSIPATQGQMGAYICKLRVHSSVRKLFLQVQLSTRKLS